MSKERNQNLEFWHIVLAVIIGLFIFQWLNENQSNLKPFAFLALSLWVIYIIASSFTEYWKDRKWWKQHEKEELEFVKSQGYESWAEYMVDHGSGEDVRKSWKEEALKEKERRAKR